MNLISKTPFIFAYINLLLLLIMGVFLISCSTEGEDTGNTENTENTGEQPLENLLGFEQDCPADITERYQLIPADNTITLSWPAVRANDPQAIMSASGIIEARTELPLDIYGRARSDGEFGYEFVEREAEEVEVSLARSPEGMDSASFRRNPISVSMITYEIMDRDGRVTSSCDFSVTVRPNIFSNCPSDDVVGTVRETGSSFNGIETFEVKWPAQDAVHGGGSFFCGICDSYRTTRVHSPGTTITITDRDRRSGEDGGQFPVGTSSIGVTYTARLDRSGDVLGDLDTCMFTVTIP